MKIEAHDLFFKIKHVRGAHGSDAHLSLRAWLIATPVVRPLPAGRNLMMVAGPHISANRSGARLLPPAAADAQ